MNFIKLIHNARGMRVRTRLWRLMVYSRETTSAMAERVVVFFGLLPGLVLGVVFGVGIFADALA